MFLTRLFTRTKLAPTLTRASRMPFIIIHDRKLQDKEKGEENVYFSKQERDALRRLLNKMEKQAAEQEEAVDASTTEDEGDDSFHSKMKRAIAKEKGEGDEEELHKIFEAHGVKEDSKLKEDLKKWKESKK